MGPIDTIYYWNSLKGQYPWCVGVDTQRVLSRMRTPELAEEYAKRLRGQEIHGYVESVLDEPRKVLANAKVILEKPST